MNINLDGVAFAMMIQIDEPLKGGGIATLNIASVEAILKEFAAQ